MNLRHSTHFTPLYLLLIGCGLGGERGSSMCHEAKERETGGQSRVEKFAKRPPEDFSCSDNT